MRATSVHPIDLLISLSRSPARVHTPREERAVYYRHRSSGRTLFPSCLLSRLAGLRFPLLVCYPQTQAEDAVSVNVFRSLLAPHRFPKCFDDSPVYSFLNPDVFSVDVSSISSKSHLGSLRIIADSRMMQLRSRNDVSEFSFQVRYAKRATNRCAPCFRRSADGRCSIPTGPRARPASWSRWKACSAGCAASSTRASSSSSGSVPTTRTRPST